MDGMQTAFRQLAHWYYSRIITLREKYVCIFRSIGYEQLSEPYEKKVVDPRSRTFTSELTAALEELGKYGTCLVVPVEDVDYHQIIAQAREYPNVVTVVVQNRGLGHAKIDLSKDDVDMFVVEAGPSYYSGGACCALYVSKKMQERFYRPHPFDPTCGDLMWGAELKDSVLLDTTPLVAMCAAAKFRNSVLGGNDAAMQYQTDLARQAAKYLAEAWKVKECGAGATFHVESPFQPIKALAGTFIEFVKSHLLREHKIAVSMMQLDEKIVFQFRAKVFLELEDFQAIKPAVDEAIHMWMKERKDKTL